MVYSQWYVFDKRTSVLIAQNCVARAVFQLQTPSLRSGCFGDLRCADNAVCVSYLFIFIAVCKGALSGSDYKSRVITN